MYNAKPDSADEQFRKRKNKKNRSRYDVDVASCANMSSLCITRIILPNIILIKYISLNLKKKLIIIVARASLKSIPVCATEHRVFKMVHPISNAEFLVFRFRAVVSNKWSKWSVDSTQVARDAKKLVS